MTENNKNNDKYKRPVYIRPEDTLEVILNKIDSWKTIEKIKDNITQMLWYFKDKKYDKLANEFGLES